MKDSYLSLKINISNSLTSVAKSFLEGVVSLIQELDIMVLGAMSELVLKHCL